MGWAFTAGVSIHWAIGYIEIGSEFCFTAFQPSDIQYETLRWIAGVVSNLRRCQHEASTCALTLASAPKAGMLYNVRNATACDLRHRFLKHRGELLFEGLSWSLRLLSEAV